MSHFALCFHSLLLVQWIHLEHLLFLEEAFEACKQPKPFPPKRSPDARPVVNRLWTENNLSLSGLMVHIPTSGFNQSFIVQIIHVLLNSLCSLLQYVLNCLLLTRVECSWELLPYNSHKDRRSCNPVGSKPKVEVLRPHSLVQSIRLLPTRIKKWLHSF